MRGDNVKLLQQALIAGGYLTGTADGIFGLQTEEAVRAFQRKNRLKEDGLAGTKTQAALNIKTSKKDPDYFSGDYSLINESSGPNRIKLLQKALIRMNYLNGTADGTYGTLTKAAVRSFQQGHDLKTDGIAGKRTLKTIEKAISEGTKAKKNLENTDPLPADTGKTKAPDKNSIQLLHWYQDIKPSLKYRAKLLIYEPVSGLSWTLMVHSKGRHCDAEPLTLMDTQIMLKAFGNQNTWSQKGVYVKLPDGRWTVGSTHTVPHLTGYIKDNGFDGHLCVHFFRDMEECRQKDPNYGVSNQHTIRALWKRVSGKRVD